MTTTAPSRAPSSSQDPNFGEMLDETLPLPGAVPLLGAEQRDALELAVRTLLEKLSATERAVVVHAAA